MNLLSLVSKIGVVSTMIIYISCSSKLNQTLIENVTIYGNCSMCKSKIETAVGQTKYAKVSWNEKSKIATLTYNQFKTSKDQILKQIALAGYDSDSYLAPDDAYAKLADCCQYERVKKIAIKYKLTNVERTDTLTALLIESKEIDHALEDHSIPHQLDTSIIVEPTSNPAVSNTKNNHDPSIEKVVITQVESKNHEHTTKSKTTTSPKKEYKPVKKSPITTKPKVVTKTESTVTKNEPINPNRNSMLKPVFNSYFSLKDAMINIDAVSASSKAKSLSAALKAIKMNELSNREHIAWMSVNKKLMADADLIAGFKDIKKQRSSFFTLSKNMYELMKVSENDDIIYYQFCPMANDGKGATWLSKDKAVKNPYYGKEMLTCGKTIEIIK